jgi:hypothetical protein
MNLIKQLTDENIQLILENENLKWRVKELCNDLKAYEKFKKDVETDIEKMFNDYVKKE